MILPHYFYQGVFYTFMLYFFQSHTSLGCDQWRARAIPKEFPEGHSGKVFAGRNIATCQVCCGICCNEAELVVDVSSPSVVEQRL